MTIKISCIIPTCNRPEFLKKAIESVLSQTVLPMEIIIVNNGKDRIKLADEILSKVIIHNTEPYIGASAARNVGAKMAKGEILAFLDDDDLWAKDYLKNIARAFDRDKDCVISRLDILENGEIKPHKNADKNLTMNNLLTSNPGVNGSNLAVKKDIFFKVGGFDENLVTSEDKSLIIELIKAQTKIKILPGNQVIFRNNTDELRLTGAKTMARGIYAFTKKYKSLMSWRQYLYNWHKIYYYRYKAGKKLAIIPSIFLKIIAGKI